MTNRTLLVAGAAGLVALTGAALLVILVGGEPVPGGATGGGPGGVADAGAAGAPAPAWSPLPSAQVEPPPAAPPAPAASPAVTPVGIRAQPSASASVDWREIPVAVRFSDLGPQLAAPVKRSLDEARDRMDHCFRAEAEALAAGPAEPVDPDAPMGPAVLILSLESRAGGGGLEVVATELESRGNSTRALVACCRAALKGWTIDAPAPPDRRYRLKLLLD